MIVGQRDAVVANRGQAVSECLLGPKRAEGVSGSDSGHDRRSANFASPASRPRAMSMPAQGEVHTRAQHKNDDQPSTLCPRDGGTITGAPPRVSGVN